MEGPVIPCDGEVSVFHLVPYLLFPNDTNQTPDPLTGRKDNNIRLLVHLSLVSAGFILAVLSLFLQFWKPLPYGKLSDADGSCNVPVRISYVAAHLIPGFVIFTVTYFTGLHFRSPLNIVLLLLFALHYFTRGLIFPLIFRYSQSKVTVWVPLYFFLTNTYFHYVNAEFIGSVEYCRGFYYDPRFIIGVILFVTGLVVNRISDIQTVFLRKTRRERRYFIPRGFLFNVISCPNYLGEGLQWMGWAMMTWSLAGLVWWLFLESLFIPRARHNHKWYKNQFSDYPFRRSALIPLIY